MNIVKHGCLYNEFYMECSKCSCKFMFLKKEIKYDEEIDFNAETIKFQPYVLCPECRAYLVVNKEECIEEEK